MDSLQASSVISLVPILEEISKEKNVTLDTLLAEILLDYVDSYQTYYPEQYQKARARLIQRNDRTD